MFDTEANELRRMGDATVPRSCVSDCQHAHLGWHAIEILHAFADGVVTEDPSQCSGNRDLSGRLPRERRAIRVQEDFIDGRQITKQSQKGNQFSRG